MPSASTRATLTAYVSAIKELNSNWEQFHRNYDVLLRVREADLILSQAVDRLSLLIGDFRENVIE